MGITLPALKAIEYVSGKSHLLGKAAMFSYHDLLVDERTLKDVARLSYHEQLLPRDDSPAILRFHKLHDYLPVVYDTTDFIKRLGYDLTVFDLVQARGTEVTHDLSRPLPVVYRDGFDWVFDGVLHQVFNPAQCLINAASICRQGGYVIVQCAANQPNAGWWSVSPTTLNDFFSQNGFVVEQLQVYTGPRMPGLINDPTAYTPREFDSARGCELPYESTLLCVARRKRRVPAVSPTQSKFRTNPHSKADKT